MRTTSPYDGYSRDQFYRRIKLLTDAGLISPQRGRHNEIILSPKEERILREFRAIEQNSPKLSLDLCLERLQARLLREELENVRSQLDYLRAENKNLRTVRSLPMRD